MNGNAFLSAQATLLYQPPYPPDFNPIEQLFAKLKTLLLSQRRHSCPGLISVRFAVCDSDLHSPAKVH